MTDEKRRDARLPAEIQETVAGLPAPLEASALRAFSRLIGGVTSYFAAWTRRPAQAVEDKTDAKSLMVQSLAKAAAEQAASDPELVEAAMKAYLPSQFRKHANKERVVEAAAENLAANGSKADAAVEDEDVDEDWLNAFERFAEDASSERLQKLWGRVLAGEITTKGSYSKRTLRFIAELDTEIARDCEVLAGYLVADFLPLTKEQQRSLYMKMMEVEHCGLLEGASALGLEKTFTISDIGLQLIPGREHGLVLHAEPGSKISIPAAAILTSTGRQVFSLLELGEEEERFRTLAKLISGEDGGPRAQKIRGLQKMSLVKVADEGGNRYRYWEIEALWTKAE